MQDSFKGLAALKGLAATAMLAATCSAFAAIPEQVRIDSGVVAGTVARDASVKVFKGIPFAAPPVGDNRWRAPQPVASWQGVRDAKEFGQRCTQGGFGGRRGGNAAPPSGEDCLYLNVWTTADSASARRPVLVWIYGGGFFGGAGSEPRYDGESLAKKGAVVVTFNYRLGSFGFLALPALTAESPHHASGDYGVMDALAALAWVKRNIEAFGGDPANVTVAGESAGAIMIGALVASPLAKGLFHRAIAQSGAWMGLGAASMATLKRAEQSGAAAAEKLGAHSLAELRALPAATIQQGLRSAGLVVDGYVIPEDASLTFAAAGQNHVDVLVGSNRDEGTFFARGQVTAEQFKTRVRGRFGEHADELLRLYPADTDAQANASSLALASDEVAWEMRKFAELQAKQGNRAYLYRFAHVPPSPPGRPSRGATHTAELAYMFDNLDGAAAWTDLDRKLADTMSQYWVNFAATGDPNGPGLPEWPAYAGSMGKMIVLGDTVKAAPKPIPAESKLEFLDAAYARLMKTLH